MKRSKDKFSESVDPRFMGFFNNSSQSKSESSSKETVVPFTKTKENTGAKRSTFSDFLSEMLYECIDDHIKVVERPAPSNDLSGLQVSEIRLFENSSPITGDEVVVEQKVPKKKRKKEKSERELLRQVAVTPEWLARQAKLMNS